MRSVFDQYEQSENKLTHALAYSLHADRRLLRAFIRWTGIPDAPRKSLRVLEQQLPGEEPASTEEEALERGLPDACICNDAGWALIVESKVRAAPDSHQIRRHVSCLERREFRTPHVLWLTVLPVRGRLTKRCINRTWCELYEWLLRCRTRSSWARHLLHYFEVFETRSVKQEYLREGTLTRFAGIPFDADSPYNYLEAKRVLGLLRDKLIRNGRLHRKLGADPNSEGRGAITGKRGSKVWDYISLRQSRNADAFTRYPHLTLGIHDDSANARVTFPNGLLPLFRRRLAGEDFETFKELVQTVTSRLIKALRHARGAIPQVVVLQRHYLSQRSHGIEDAALIFDLRTAFPGRGSHKVRGQDEWLRAAHEAFRRKRSNLQLQVGAEFPYATCRKTGSARIADLMAEAWIACKPMIDAAIADGPHRTAPKSRVSKSKKRRPARSR